MLELSVSKYMCVRTVLINMQLLELSESKHKAVRTVSKYRVDRTVGM